MPTIKFDKKTLDKVRSRKGVYSAKPKQSTLFTTNDIKEIEQRLQPILTQLIKDAFIKYAKAHGCKPENLELEWNRFNSFLQKKF